MSFKDWTRRVLLSLDISDIEKEAQLSLLLSEATPDQVHSLLGPEIQDNVIYTILQTHRETHSYFCFHIFEELFSLYPDIVASYFDPSHIKGLFSDDGDDLRGGVFLWRLLKFKYERSKYEYTCEKEANKILRILEKQYDLESARNIPPCTLRYSLLKILVDIPPTRSIFEK